MKQCFLTAIVSFFIVTSTFCAQLQPNWKSVGKLEELSESLINISDTSYKVSSKINFYSISGRYVTRSDFHKGDKVVVSFGENEIVNGIWLVDEDPP